MTGIVSVSLAELTHRRSSLRRRRRRQLIHGIWRTLTVSSLAGGLCWGASQPAWVLRNPQQITIEGNHLLSDDAIRSLLAVTYPQSLLRIEPQGMAQKLAAPKSLIAKATVTRQLFPPSLTIKVQERQPVAIAIRPRPPLVNQPAETGKSTPSQPLFLGLIDENGTLIPPASYQPLKATIPPISLKVIGFQQQLPSYWPQLYQAVHSSSVKVFEINCQDQGNLILKTELGIVHLGAYSSKLPEQLNVLDRLRQLPAYLKNNQIAYIDLKNPESPAIQMLETKIQSNLNPMEKTLTLQKKRT